MSDPSDNVREHDLIYDRYELVRELGRGGQATTWLARDLVTDTEVALKELSLERVVEWKAVELFEREGQALASIDHPQVPDYIDAFHIEGEDEHSRFFLAQEYVSGESLAERIERGYRAGWDEAVELLEDLLSVLAYLHDRSPPIIHRDIKPSNVLIDDDGDVVLVDFGAVQLVLPNTVGGSTIVGTTGFFPMEQLMGKAVPASDLYAVGATVVHVMSGRHPAELDMKRNRLRFEHVLDAPAWFESFLRRLLEPAAEDRFDDGGEALAFFEQLRDAGEPDTTSEGDDGGWLQTDSRRVLVEHRATEETVYRIECVEGESLDDSVERKPGNVELKLHPDEAVLTYTTGESTTMVTPGGFAAIVALGVVLAIPLAVVFRFTAFILGALGLMLYLQARHSPQERRVEIYADRVEVYDGANAVDYLRYPRQTRFESVEGSVYLFSEGDLEEVKVAGGLDEEQARWLTARLERVRAQFADQNLIEVDAEQTK